MTLLRLATIDTIQVLIRLEKCSNPETYSFPEAKKEEINTLIKRLNPKKPTGPNRIPLKIIKLSADVIDKHLTQHHKHRFRMLMFFRKC